jgi:5,6-dimethylbenzimidazole synthase
MELMDAIKGRRSVRAFADTPVSDADLDAIIEAATWAPSPLHLQPWSFVVIKSVEAKAEVLKCCQQAKDGIINADGPEWVKKYSFDFITQAPVLVAVFYNPKKGGLGPYFNQPHGALQAASAAIQNLMLAAWEQGLGSLWLTFFDPMAMAKALSAPEGLEVAGIIPLGLPAAESKAPPRKAAKVFIERYGE